MMLVFFRSVMVRHRQWACLKLSPAYFSTMNDSRTIEETIQYVGYMLLMQVFVLSPARFF